MPSRIPRPAAWPLLLLAACHSPSEPLADGALLWSYAPQADFVSGSDWLVGYGWPRRRRTAARRAAGAATA